jgi:two-component system, chemotaxis family, protein-glutamate methylesterase/glutaminase
VRHRVRGEPATAVVVIGGSAGALPALRGILGSLPAHLDAAVLVAMHTTPKGPGRTVEVLQRATLLHVVHPAHVEPLRNGCVYVAPPDQHLQITRDCAKTTRDAEEHYTRPAVDVLFRSAASTHERNVIAVLLSGTGSDGAAGLIAVHDHGGVVIVQAPEDATFDFMPRRALDVMTPDYILPAVHIGAAVQRVLRSAGRVA